MDSTQSSPSTPALSQYILKRDNVGIFLWIGGIILLVTSLSLQYTMIDNGSSGQLNVDMPLNTTVWAVATGVIMLAVGYCLWLSFSMSANKYLAVFMLSMSSYILANFAILFSLYQVHVQTV